MSNTPEKVARYLDERQRRLYELVWKRAVASQMQSAELDQVAVDIGRARGRPCLRATGSVIAFDGFLKLYREDEDDAPPMPAPVTGADEEPTSAPCRRCARATR